MKILYFRSNPITIYNRFKKKLSRDEALKKAQKFCAYRDRCANEMEVKLKEWGLSQKDIDHIVDDLVETNFINDGRFALSFARGKFNNNKWGRFKIRLALREKRIHDEVIESAISKLDEKEYLKTARNLVENKKEQFSGDDERQVRSKVYYFMVSKGYEPEVVMRLLG